MTNTRVDSERARELKILETLEQEPELRQVDLAVRLGVAVGTINWLLKHMAAKGYVKVKRIGQWRWRYLLTPLGFAEKAKLTRCYLKDSMCLYRTIRREARTLLDEVKSSGYRRVRVDGSEKNDIADVCRLTCLEMGVALASGEEEDVPLLCIEGQRLALNWPTNGSNDRVWEAVTRLSREAS